MVGWTGGTWKYLGMWDDVMTVSHTHNVHPHTHTSRTQHTAYQKHRRWTEISFGTGAGVDEDWQGRFHGLAQGRAMVVSPCTIDKQVSSCQALGL